MVDDMPQDNFLPQDPTPAENSATNLPPAPTPWSVRNLFVLLVSAALALLVANILAVSGYMALQPFMGWTGHPQALRDNPFFLLTLQSIFHGLLLGLVYLLLVVNCRQPFWAALKWHVPTRRRALSFFLGGIVLAVAIQLAPPLLPDQENFPLQRLFTSPQAGYAIGAFAVLIAPFMEELIFRGVLFSFFEHLVGGAFAILGTAALFAVLHVPEYWGAWNHVLLIFVVGVVFSLARGLTGSLVPSVILHMAYNTSLMVVLFFQTQQFRALQGLLTH